MRIIKHGRDPYAGEIQRSKCLWCKTEFEWETSEARIVQDPRDGNYYEIACPVCERIHTKAIKAVEIFQMTRQGDEMMDDDDKREYQPGEERSERGLNEVLVASYTRARIRT